MRLTMLAALSATLVSPVFAASPLEDLRQAFGVDDLHRRPTFAYTLRITDDDGALLRDASYRLAPASGRLHVEDRRDRSRSWWDGQRGWRLNADGDLLSLGNAAAAPLAAHVRTHFLRLWSDPATGATPLEDGWLRIQPADGAPFDVLTDPATGLIAQNRFEDGTIARESGYRSIDGVQWPMQFDVTRTDGRHVRAAFEDVRFDIDPALPDIALAAIADVERHVPHDTALRVAPGVVSTPRNEYNMSTDAAATVRVFARSDADFAGSRIWVSQRRGDGWSAPQPVSFTDARHRDSDPWLTPDGRIMYFISDRPATARAEDRTDLDIWRVARDANGNWTQPEHLPAVNSEQQELGPELHDGVLYFNSSRPGGPAMLSLYQAKRTDAGFSEPTALPAPFNDGRAQGDMTLSPDRRIALFWSIRGDRPDGDLFLVRRDGAGWSATAERLPPPYNSSGFDFTPAFSADGHQLSFASDRRIDGAVERGTGAGGLADLYIAGTQPLHAGEWRPAPTE